MNEDFHIVRFWFITENGLTSQSLPVELPLVAWPDIRQRGTIRRLLSSHPLLKPCMEAAALAALLCCVTLLAGLVYGLSGQRLMTLYCVNLCAVIAFQLYSGNSGVISFGHTAFMGVGAYLSAWLTMPAALQSTTLPNLPAWLAGHELALLFSFVIVLAIGVLLAVVSGFSDFPVGRCLCIHRDAGFSDHHLFSTCCRPGFHPRQSNLLWRAALILMWLSPCSMLACL